MEFMLNQIKPLKKTSLVYALQVIAVVLLFSYRGASTENEATGDLKNKVLPTGIGKQSQKATFQDSLLSSEMIDLPSTYTGTNW